MADPCCKCAHPPAASQDHTACSKALEKASQWSLGLQHIQRMATWTSNLQHILCKLAKGTKGIAARSNRTLLGATGGFSSLVVLPDLRRRRRRRQTSRLGRRRHRRPAPPQGAGKQCWRCATLRQRAWSGGARRAHRACGAREVVEKKDWFLIASCS